jgi:hypothetical protein
MIFAPFSESSPGKVKEESPSLVSPRQNTHSYSIAIALLVLDSGYNEDIVDLRKEGVGGDFPKTRGISKWLPQSARNLPYNGA